MAIFSLAWSAILLGVATASPIDHGHRIINSFGIPNQDASYDYVVVGGGTAGNAIAARLAQIPNISVAVIEAGGFYQTDNGNGSIIPAIAGSQWVGSDPKANHQPLIDWNFVTTPQAGADDREMLYARGKTLGGTSARNYMAYQRPTKGSLKLWADQVGDESYLWDSVLPYYEKSVNLTPPNMQKRFSNASVKYDASVFKTSDGPVHLSWPDYAIPFNTWAATGLQGAGVNISQNNFQSGELDGGAWVPLAINPQTSSRESSQTSFLDMAMRTTDIKVYTQTFAEQILFDKSKTARSVRVSSGGATFTLNANKEIILSAGVFQSPQLLMVSGVGPRQVLESHGIKVIKDSPGVGQNMNDHSFFAIDYRVNLPTMSMLTVSAEYAAEAEREYLVNGTGVLSSPTDYLSFERLPEEYRGKLSNSTKADLAEFPSDWPDMEYIFANGYCGYQYDYNVEAPRDGYNYAAVLAALIAPTSKGNVTISSANMSAPPIINPAWLTTETDIEMAIVSFKRIRDIWAHIPITIGDEYFPGSAVATDEEILAYIRKTVIEIWHGSSTCKMGKTDDPMAVIDSKARVYGVNGLRVVDASSFPFLPPGHPMSTIYMLAEKIAEDIRSEL